MKKGELPGRIVFVIAALACVATSAPKWSLTADPLPGAPTKTAAGASKGVLLVIESSRMPAVRCTGAGWNELNLPPIAASGVLAMDQESSQKTHTFLCPPGGEVHGASIGDRGGVGGGLCGRTHAPPNELVKILSQDLVPVWSKTAEKTTPIHLGANDQLTTVSVQLRSPFTTTVVAHVEPATDQVAYANPVYVARTLKADAGWGDRWSVVVNRTASTSTPVDSTLRIIATASGPCAGACAAPGGDITIEIE